MIVEARDPFVMLEIGACDGYHSKQFLDMMRLSGKPFFFHAFEPVPQNFEICRRVTDRYKGQFCLWPLAVGASTGPQAFHVSGGVKRDASGKPVEHYYGSSSLRAPKLVTEAWPDMTFTPATVNAITLDDFTEAHLRDKEIDFIWADIQGANEDLARGGRETFKRVKYFYTEYDNSELYEGEGIGAAAVKALLPDFVVVEDYGGDLLLANKSFM